MTIAYTGEWQVARRPGGALSGVYHLLPEYGIDTLPRYWRNPCGLDVGAAPRDVLLVLDCRDGLAHDYPLCRGCADARPDVAAEFRLGAGF